MTPRIRSLPFSLDPAARAPLGRQIVDGVAGAVLAGRLRPGTALPGTRRMAELLGVNRSTVLEALQELAAQGWLEGRRGSGTYVAPEPPGALPPVASAPDPDLGFPLPDPLAAPTVPDPGALDLSEGFPDPRLAPVEALAKAYQRALRRHGPELLGEDEPQGNQLLRTCLAEMLATQRGLAVGPDRVVVTQGTRAGLALLALAVVGEGGAVAVEDPGNRAAWETLRQAAGAELVPIPVDRGGMDLDRLARVLAQGRVRLVYTTPRYQFPTGVPWAPERREALLALAAAHRVAVVEDDPEADFHYGPAPEPPLAAQDAAGTVVHLGSLSRVLAPGLRLGYLVVPASLAAPLAAVRRRLDLQGDRVLEWAVADLWRDGELMRHLRRARKAYQARRDLMAGLLRDRFGDRLAFEVPAGGLGLWVRGAPGAALQDWADRARRAGVRFHPGRRYSFHGEALPCARLGFAQADEIQIREGILKLHQALA